MSDEHHGVGDSPALDTGLACLVMLARFHNVAAFAEQRDRLTRLIAPLRRTVHDL